MKKLIAIVLIMSMLFTFTGCNKTKPKTEDTVKTPVEENEPEKEGEKESEKEVDEEETIDPSEGTAFSGIDNNMMVGSYTINSEWVPFKDSYIVDSIFGASVVNIGDTYFIMADKKLKQYGLDDGTLVFEKDIELDGDYEVICKDDKDILYVSGFMRDFVAFEDGKQIFSHSGIDKAAIHPSGKWGISWFTGPEVKKFTLGDGTIQTEDWKFEELDSVSSISIGQKHIFVSGRSVENQQHAIFIYDLNGKFSLKLGDAEFGEQDSLGSVTRVVETKNGFMALDGNMREICLWKLDGTFIGKMNVKKLFETSYPWISSAEQMPDGSIIIGLTQEREDKSGKEFLVYRLTGF